ncbi:23S rRNA (uracil(1939)-C(5))-methyltransferase RlmD [Metamycoplasma canadense]|uniref:tRNA (Uracil-5-)-methyltransferase related enzyme n=1 Tax=Metamycoplasma canadense TaxID=29554 RepID=A0A077L5X9_9BACT|nr:23S rRNA (uracil(1939)-C(5))-methyltransferase RlmD [Metamycoplasma canadense]BAP39402.1 tRNA (uracil-5-)-methyltransferase related enzyme [Metamycoplasma canadense]
MGYKKTITLQENLIIKRVKSDNLLFYSGLSYEGLCIIRNFDIPIFVYNMLPDEEADIQITYYSKKCCFAKVIKYRKLSDLRDELDVSKNKLYETGSAPLLSLPYKHQLKFKQTIINNLFERNLNYKNIFPIVPSCSELGYRNKISVHVEYNDEKPILGFFKKYSHELVEQDDLHLGTYCIRNFYKNILFQPQNDLNLKINKTIFKFKPSKIVLRSPKSSFSFIEIILKVPTLENKNLIKELEELNKEVLQYKFSIFEKDTKNWTNLLNHEGINYEIGNLSFSVKNNSFYQTNENIMNLIYKKINEWIKFQNLTILDSFGGVGTIGIFVSPKASKVYTVDINPISTKMAKNNIEVNKIVNVEAINADANKWLEQNYEKVDLVIFDPPRDGLTQESIKAILKSKIKNIIYLSCDPKTLVRDLKQITEKDYEIKEVIPYDMFPQTHHIETLVLLEKIS